MARFHTKKDKLPVSGFLSIALLIGVLVLFSLVLDNIHTANDSEQAQILETAVTQSVTACYALEGAYPPTIEYLTEHYGLTYDTNQYFIDYRYIGANLRPDVTIIKKDNSL